MPLMFLTYTEGTFTPEALGGLANQITHDGVELEGLPLTDYVLSTTWVNCNELPRTHIFHGGEPSQENFVSVLINVIQGGYNEKSKAQLIQRVTDAVAEYGELPDGEPRRVYVLIREVPESNWGFDGVPIALEDLRHPPKEAVAL